MAGVLTMNLLREWFWKVLQLQILEYGYTMLLQ